jgi:hypothetical protein
MEQTHMIFDHVVIAPTTVHATYASASRLANRLNDDDATLESGWSYSVVEYRGGYAVEVIDDDNEVVGKL